MTTGEGKGKKKSKQAKKTSSILVIQKYYRGFRPNHAMPTSSDITPPVLPAALPALLPAVAAAEAELAPELEPPSLPALSVQAFRVPR